MSEEAEGQDGTNTFDPKRVEKIIKKIEAEFEGLKSEQMSYASKCRPYRERIGLAYKEGVDFGIPKRILKEKIKERKLERQLECIGQEFEDDDKETFEQLTQALGGYADTPLGKAAVNAATKADEKPRSRKKADAPAGEQSAADKDAAASQENADRLKSGIKGLPGAEAPGKHTVQ